MTILANADSLMPRKLLRDPVQVLRAAGNHEFVVHIEKALGEWSGEGA